ncbi:hypothetical protein AGOR_G00201380 [Albula goreensis]|uniref:ALMS motif domain-containing protein n=1 Tax=Albula goreensis TaxID=1534307 RepID=A0A8T3CUP6_9TELE|nr:hypothetical protein AGOR_G00201380 [Albula goreensis]
MEVKSEHRGRLSEPHRRVGMESTRPRGRGPAWRRSGDEGYWESLMSEVEVLPHAQRPQSCIGGIGVEGWLQQLERAQAHPPGGAISTHTTIPPLSDRTVSMPTLHGGTTSRGPHRRYPGYALPHRQDHGHHRPSSCYETPQGSEEDLFAPPGQWETARFRCTPQAEPVRVSALASVKNSWLPIQRRAVVCGITYHSPSLEHSTSQDQFNPFITTIIPKKYVKKDGLDHSERKETDRSRAQADCIEPITRRSVGQTTASTVQTSGRGDFASLESDLQLGREWWRKGREERRSAFFSQGIHSGDYYNGVEGAVSHRKTPLHRTVSAPVPSRPMAPPAGAEMPPKKRPGVNSITVTAQRMPQRQTAPLVPNTRSQDDDDRCSITSSSTSPSLENQPANHASQPVVLRRRASAIKVAKMGSCIEETSSGVKPRQFRYSYTEGEDKENALSRAWLQDRKDPAGCSLSGSTQPSAHTEASVGSQNVAQHLDKSCSVSLVEPAVGQKIYRSTLSLHLGRPSSGAPAGGHSGRPRRPLSFAGVVGHTNPGLHGLPDAATKQQSHGSPEKANIGCMSNTACNPNMQPSSAGLPGAQTSQPNMESSKQNVGAMEGLGPHTEHSRSQNSSVIKAETGAHQSAEAILALNAASIIANIKLQARLNKMTNLISAQESKMAQESATPQDSENASVKVSGKAERGPPDGGVIRRGQGNTGRKARPRPIHGGSIWPDPLSDRQEDIAPPLTLREALELLRPDFISRSQRRVKEVEQRARKREALQRSALEPGSTQGARRRRSAGPNPLSDNHHKPTETAMTGKEPLLRSKRNYCNLPAVQKRREEEKKRAMSQTNRLRAEVFKKKLLDQILQRNLD